MTHIVKYIKTRLLPKDKKETLRIKKEIMFILTHERPLILTRIHQSSIKMFNKERRNISFRGNSQKLNITTPRWENIGKENPQDRIFLSSHEQRHLDTY